MNKTTEALELAEKTLEDIIRVYKFETGTPVTALAAIREALAEQDKQEPVVFKFVRYVDGKEMAEGVTIEREKTLDAAIKKAVALCPNRDKTVLVYAAPVQPVKQEPVAVISESAIGLVKLHSNGVSLPFGTQLYAAPVDAKAIREALAEQSKCACDSPAWCTKYKKCNREMLGLPKAEPVKQEPVVMDESWCLEPQPVSCSTSYERHLSCGERTND